MELPSRMHAGRAGRIAALAAPVLLVAACSAESFKPVPAADQTELYWALELNHHAVLLSTVSPWDTLTLVATPRNAEGGALAGLPMPTFTSGDAERVIVSPDGVVQALVPTSPGATVRVVATLTYHNLKHADTVLVSVVDSVPPAQLASLSIHPIPPDSAKVAASQVLYGGINTDTLPVRAIMSDGSVLATIPGSANGRLPVWLHSSDTVIAQPILWHGELEVAGFQPGVATLYATATAFGVTRADTLQYRTGWPLTTYVYVGLQAGAAIVPTQGVSMSPDQSVFSVSEVTLGVGAVVFWYSAPAFSGSSDTTSTDVTFAEADAPNVHAFDASWSRLSPGLWLVFCSGLFQVAADCGSGSSFLLGSNQNLVAARVFPVPGTYEYRSVLNPSSVARIIVIDER